MVAHLTQLVDDNEITAQQARELLAHFLEVLDNEDLAKKIVLANNNESAHHFQQFWNDNEDKITNQSDNSTPFNLPHQKTILFHTTISPNEESRILGNIRLTEQEKEDQLNQLKLNKANQFLASLRTTLSNV